MGAQAPPMKSYRRRLVCAGIAAALLAACGEKPRAQPFPALAVPPLDGSGGTLETLHRRAQGAPRSGFLLINYWATWCAPCREEMPSLERLSRKLPPEVGVVAVTVDEDLNLAREWLRKLGITFPVFADPAMRLSRGALGMDVLPETFLVAPDRLILERTRGAREWDADASYGGILAAVSRWKPSGGEAG